jgi:hypothetical protein
MGARRLDTARALRATPAWPGLVCHVLSQHLGEPVTPELLGWPEAGPLRYVAADDGLAGGSIRPSPISDARCP